MILREIYYLAKVLRQDSLDRTKSKELRLFFLKNVVEDAYNSNKLYRTLYSDNGFRPEDIRRLDDIQRIPKTDKQTLLRNRKLFLDKKNRYLKSRYSISTSGSSSEPLEIRLDDEDLEYSSCIFTRSLMRQGYNPFMKIGFYWYRKEKNSQIARIFSRKILLDGTMTPEREMQIIKKYHLKYLYFFPFKLLEFCLHFDKKNIRELGMKKIFCIGEMLTPKMAEFLKEMFGCDICDNYASSEFNIIAFRKGLSGRYTINDDNVIVELEDAEDIHCKDHKNLKRTVITSLSNHTTPLIRYSTDDIVQTDYSGNIVRILGRKESFIHGIYLGDVIDTLLDYHDCFWKFNFHLEKNGKRNMKSIIINIDPKKAFSDEKKLLIEARIRKKFGINAELRCAKENIFFFRTGKINLLYNPRKRIE